MKKGVVLLSWAFALCLLLIWCSNGNISKKDAQDIALQDAHVTRADVVFTKTELNREDKVYEIEFTVWENEFEYEIDAKNGEIKIDDDFAVYTEKDAKSIAVVDAWLSEDAVTFLETKTVEIEDKTHHVVKFVDEWGKMCDYAISAIDGSIYDSKCEQSDYREKDEE